MKIVAFLSSCDYDLLFKFIFEIIY